MAYNKDELIESLKEANIERQKIINRLVYEGLDKSNEISVLNQRIEILERFVFRAYKPGRN